MAGTLLSPRVSRNQQNMQLSYELPHRIHAARVYPVPSSNGSTILLYGHENGVKIIWRGGRRFKPPQASSIAPKKANGTEDTVMILDSDEEDPPAETSEDKPEFEDDEEESDLSTPYPAILQVLDLYFGTDVVDLALLPPSSLRLESPTLRSIELLREKIVFTAACADNSVRLVILPLTPPSPASKNRSEFRSNFTQANAGNGKWGETVVILSGHLKPSDGVSMTIDLSKNPHSKRESYTAGSNVAATIDSDIIVASHSREIKGLLLLWRVSVSSPKSPAEPFQTVYLASPATSISFNPVISGSNSSHLLVADNVGSCRIYDFKLTTKNLGADDASIEIPTTEQGSWLLSLYAGFENEKNIAESSYRGAHPGFGRKNIVDAKWVSGGKAVTVLLNDGEWGIWDIEGVGPSAPQGLLGRHGIKGGSRSEFSLTGYLDGSTRVPLARNSGPQVTTSKFTPMTPSTRKSTDPFNNWGQGTLVRGQISVVEVPSSSSTNPSEESVVFWLGESFAVIPSLPKFWIANSRKGSGGSGNLFNGAPGGRLIRLESVDLQGERCSGIDQLVKTHVSPGFPTEILIVEDLSFYATNLRTSERLQMDPFTVFSQSGLSKPFVTVHKDLHPPGDHSNTLVKNHGVMQFNVNKPANKGSTVQPSRKVKGASQKFEFVNSSNPYRNKDPEIRRLVRTHVVKDFTRKKQLQEGNATKKTDPKRHRELGKEKENKFQNQGNLDSSETKVVQTFNQEPRLSFLQLDPHPQLSAIICHIITVGSAMYPLEVVLHFNPLSPASWFEFAFSDEALFHALMYTTSAYAGLISGSPETKEAITHMGKSISLVNTRLETMTHDQREGSLSIADGTIGAALCGNLDGWKIHMAGVKQLVETKGGIEKLGTVLRIKLRRADLTGAVHYLTKPLFNPPRSLYSPLYSHFHFYSNEALTPAKNKMFHQLLVSLPIQQSLVAALLAISQFSSVIDQMLSKPRSFDIHDQLHIVEFIYSIRYTLLDSIQDTGPKFWFLLTMEETWDEVLSVGALMYMQETLQEFPYSAIGSGILVKRMKDLIPIVKITSKDEGALVTWLLFMGGLSSQQTEDRKWFVSHLERLTARLGIQIWDAVKGSLEGVLWIEKLHERPCLHQPTGLQYAIQERLLPPDPPSSSYTWHNTCDIDVDSVSGDDELLVTSRCVIWSRGGIFRKCYKFDLENEPVNQALLTSFPSVGPLAAKEKKSGKQSPSIGARSAAIVVFLKTQAHIYFLSGTSHVIHLPFEVESASAAPNGLIIQRKLRVNNLAAASLKFPRVPPNSFISSQPQPWSAASSQQSTFSIADLGSPMQMPMPPNSTLKDLWDPPALKIDSNWPRLFSLSDPLSEIGLVVTQHAKPEHRGHNRKGLGKFSALDTAEEILHISHQSELPHRHGENPLILALTLNRETSMYTVWKLSYIEQEPGSRETHRVTSGTRRRSSFVPGPGTGATTPIANSQQTFRESFGGHKQHPAMNKPARKEGGSEAKLDDFASTLDPEFESSAIPRRKSRRVSSMLARSDLSASHERSAFSELATHQLPSNRRGESLNGQHARTSNGAFAGLGIPSFPQASQLNPNAVSFLEAPVDDLLDELRAGGDFEGFHAMGLDDEEFDALRHEVAFSKICTVAAEHSNVRYSSQHMPAETQCRTFILSAPPSAADDQQGNAIVICILDPDEKKLSVLTLYIKSHKRVQLDVNDNEIHMSKEEKDITVVLKEPIMRATGIIDACKIDDGHVSRILVLTETHNGYGELSLQAPWSPLMKVSLPEKFAVSNVRNLGHNPTPRAKREGGFKRVLSQGPRALRGLRNSKPRGLVDLVDDIGNMHQLQILMQPRNPHVQKALQVCSAVIPGTREGEGTLVGWWNIMQWLRLESIEVVDTEWTALVIVLFCMVLGLGPLKQSQARPLSKQKKARGLLRSSSGGQSNSERWEAMHMQEASNGNPSPPWAENGGWKWLTDMNRVENSGITHVFPVSSAEGESFLRQHLNLSRRFMHSTLGQSTTVGSTAQTGCLPTAGNKNVDTRKAALVDALLGLHLLREEQKLDTMTADSFAMGVADLTPILAQIFRWLRWNSWIEVYDLEEVSLTESDYDSVIETPPLEPFDCPAIYEWIQSCLVIRGLMPFPNLPELVATRSTASRKNAHDLDQWMKLTPRTLSFFQFFSKMQSDWSPAQFVEALSSLGVDNSFLETLPEAILAPLQEAIVQCQTEPPTWWSKELLAVVGREDVTMLLSPGQQPRDIQSTLLAPSHESNMDVHTICASTADPETTGSFDGSAEVNRQSVTRSIFKDDRRMNEAMNILNTFKPTIAYCKSEPDWSESDLLEAQKEHAQMLAYRTLAIPSGRGLLYYSARIPLLTQRFAIGGFNLSCVMKPDNNTVAIDKNAFTEEKVCWAFFHAGVAAGLSISRDARGIDTSWILFNKPLQDLSNRHAGFLLALGLNGHLKSIAKWVAFKYLTPKHTMTSIGLLLGLAASYMGTMDSLITRLLSVHVTRMLPPGAAELNLSPLTQTTGIMGIGLLYCNTQHRRMSEIMVSEIEHIDIETDDEPLRNEGYRLAAGFALGFINLGKGSDLKGLQDMRLTERLLTLAAGSKKVNIVHVLDKATAGAVMAIALIYMKSENQVLARKIDVPDSLLQFDYVRPDIFLLRTLARHLIMWSKIEPTFGWVESNLPAPYRSRSKLENIRKLTSSDLPFYDIIAGLCFSMALRFAGSASLVVRDLLVHYLDQLMRICQIPSDTFDKKLTRNTVRNCQDLVALATATVMAGTGDITVFRRLRSMHGRDDSETPYGSHLAAHLAIGALFLGGGTFTFSTSNTAIAALLVAFYPIFPSSVQDNKSHLQAFRHFWVLAAEPRCLVTRNIDTNQPVSVPIFIALRNGEEVQRHTPCLLPELTQIKTVRTDSPEFWNVVLDLENNPTHIAAFKSTQTVYVRKRPAHDGSTSAFQATLQALNEVDGAPSQSLEWLFELPAFETFTKAERALVLPPDQGGASDIHAGTEGTVIDTRLILEHATLDGGKKDRLLGLKLLFEWADKAMSEGKDMKWIRKEVVQRLKARVWMMAEE
ncbi:hypothetical protein B7494_g1825 [Chlorociboria aeruginascens]|nr:hypothetical protein B7494_g1825 [Chlorociboria aeruginascens]